MSDWNRTPGDPRYNDMRDPMLKDGEPNSMWGWIIGGVLVVLIIGFAIGLGRDESKVAQINPPAAPSSTSGGAPTTPPTPTPPAR
jgi:hypothetical protein